MRRIETYVGQQVYEWAFSSQAQLTMTAIAKVCAALFGTGGTVNGLVCTPTSPATMTVQIGAGEIYQMESLEATTCGTLPADTTHTILKQGIQLGTYTTSAFAAPGTSGQSINYLIEAQYQDSDISLDPTTGNSPVVLQFYNSTNPSTPWSGPNNSGSTSNTFRDGVIAYTIKPGVAATTGSQVTPSPDTGWIGLWVVTVPFGASSLTSANIAQYTGTSILPTGILQSILTSNLTYGIDNGTAGVVQATFPIPVTTLTDGMDVWVKIKNANVTTATFTPNPGVISPSPIVGAAHAALQGGELIASGRANLVWRQDITSWVLVECTGAAIQIAPATASQHALQFGQIGAVGNCRLSVASTTSLQLAPYNGNIVNVNGAPLVLPSAGITVSNSGLAASTVYYVYLGGTTASPTLTLSTTGHTTQSNGITTQTGNTALTLVGMIATNSSSQFVDSSSQRFCLNWFNRRAISGGVGYNTPVTFGVQTAAEITVNNETQFINWADETVIMNYEGTIANNSASSYVSVQTYYNNTAAGSAVIGTSAVANAFVPFSSTGYVTNIEGAIVTQKLYGFVNANTGTLQSSAGRFMLMG